MSASVAAPMSAGPWKAGRFKGSPNGLKYALRDLPCLDEIVKLVPGRRVAVQAGGNLGLYPKRLAKRFAAVYTFEPAPDLFALMQQNAPEPNIIKFQAALGDERRLVGVSRRRRDGKTDNHEGITHIDGPGNIPTLRVDDLGLDVCDLLQLDLEGWELFALRGAVQTIARCRPVIVVEINKSIEFVGFERDDVRRFLHEQRYGRVQVFHSDEVYLPLERVDEAL